MLQAHNTMLLRQSIITTMAIAPRHLRRCLQNQQVLLATMVPRHEQVLLATVVPTMHRRQVITTTMATMHQHQRRQVIMVTMGRMHQHWRQVTMAIMTIMPKR